MTLHELERRIARATPRDVARRRNQVTRYRQERARALADPSCSRLKACRYGQEMTASALAVMAGCSRDTVRRAEAGDDRISDAVWRRLANALGVRVEDVKP